MQNFEVCYNDVSRTRREKKGGEAGDDREGEGLHEQEGSTRHSSSGNTGLGGRAFCVRRSQGIERRSRGSRRRSAQVHAAQGQEVKREEEPRGLGRPPLRGGSSPPRGWALRERHARERVGLTPYS